MSRSTFPRILPCLASALALLATGCESKDNPGSHELRLQIAGQGSITVVPGQTYDEEHTPATMSFENATQVQLTAIPATGWTFLQWTGDVTVTTNPAILTVDGEKQVAAVFMQAVPNNNDNDDNDNDNADNENDNGGSDNSNDNDDDNNNINDNSEDNDNGHTEPTEILVTDIQEDTTIEDGDYVVTDDIVVHEGAKLTIEAGARLEFARDKRMRIEGDGVASFIGTEDKPIVLTSADPTPGYWKGITFANSNSSSNILEYVVIEYGGIADEMSTGNLTFESESRVAIRHCTLRKSASMGFAFAQNADNAHVTFEDNVITGNTAGAGKILVQQLGVLDATSTYTGNDIERILVGVSSEQHIEDDVTWSKLDVDYEVMSTVVTYAHLIIEPGVRLLFHDDRSLEVSLNGGTLTAVGTAADPIVFTSIDPTPGYWRGIIFGASNSTSNVVQHFVLEYAGQGNASSHGAFTVWDGGRVQVDHGLIRYSEGWGIYLRGANVNADIESANTFTDNALGSVLTLD